MRYFITGGAGFIGSNMADRLLSEPENEKIQRLENEWNIKKIEQNKFLNSFVKSIISHL